MHLKSVLLPGIVAALLVLGSCSEAEVHAWDKEGLALTSAELIERGAMDVEGEVLILMSMGGFGLGGGGGGMSVRFTTVAGQEYDLSVAEDTKFIGISHSNGMVTWSAGRQYRILGFPEGGTFVAIRVELLPEADAQQ